MNGRLMALIAVVIAACTATPPPAVTRPPQEALSDVEIRPLGDAHGDWAIVFRAASGYGAPDDGEIWAVPLSGGVAKRVIGWTSYGVGGNDLRLGLSVVARQLSPDGRRIVLPVAKFPRGTGTFGARLATIDLFTGDFEVLPTPNIDMVMRPAWSPDGKRIAFDRYQSTFWSGISMINADGSGARNVCDASYANESGMGAFHGCYGVDGWTTDAKGIRFYEVDGYSVIDPDTKKVTRFGEHGASLVAASWRATSPSLALGVVDVAEWRLTIFDRDASLVRVVARAPRSGLGFFEPRWNPKSEELLVRRGGELFVYGAQQSGRQIVAAPCEVRGEWHPNGTDVLYLRQCPSTGDLRLVGPGGDRLLWSPPTVGRPDWRTVDLTVVRYP